MVKKETSKPTAIEDGSNLGPLKKSIQKGVADITRLKEKRLSINEDIASVKANLVTKGVNKKALDMAMAYMNMDPDKREGFDIAYDIVREAIDLPVQSSLFDGDGKVVPIGSNK